MIRGVIQSVANNSKKKQFENNAQLSILCEDSTTRLVRSGDWGMNLDDYSKLKLLENVSVAIEVDGQNSDCVYNATKNSTFFFTNKAQEDAFYFYSTVLTSRTNSKQSAKTQEESVVISKSTNLYSTWKSFYEKVCLGCLETAIELIENGTVQSYVANKSKMSFTKKEQEELAKRLALFTDENNGFKNRLVSIPTRLMDVLTLKEKVLVRTKELYRSNWQDTPRSLVDIYKSLSILEKNPFILYGHKILSLQRCGDIALQLGINQGSPIFIDAVSIAELQGDSFTLECYSRDTRNYHEVQALQHDMCVSKDKHIWMVYNYMKSHVTKEAVEEVVVGPTLCIKAPNGAAGRVCIELEVPELVKGSCGTLFPVKEWVYIKKNLESDYDLALFMQKRNLKKDFCDEKWREMVLHLNEKQKTIKFPLHAQQLKCCTDWVRHRLTIITGGAGTGKTTTLARLIEAYRYYSKNPDMPVLLLAPTGAAVKTAEKKFQGLSNVFCSTMHRFVLKDTPCVLHPYFKFDCSKKKNCLVIIDEASMMDSGIAAQVFNAVKKFGWVVAVGDYNQLEPIGRGSPFKQMIEFAKFPESNVLHIELDVGFRQQQVPDLAALTQSVLANAPMEYFGKSFESVAVVDRHETVDAETIIEEAHEWVGKDVRIDDIQFICTKNITCDAYNRAIGKKLRGRSPFEGKRWLFRDGDKVVVKENIYNEVSEEPSSFCSLHSKSGKTKELIAANGELGTVRKAYFKTKKDAQGKQINEDLLEIDFTFEGGPSKIISLSTSDVSPAYAITVHRSQGAEYKNVVFLNNSSFKSKAGTYTALTRAKKKCYMVAPVQLTYKPERPRISLALRFANGDCQSLVEELLGIHTDVGRELKQSECKEDLSEEVTAFVADALAAGVSASLDYVSNRPLKRQRIMDV